MLAIPRRCTGALGIYIDQLFIPDPPALTLPRNPPSLSTQELLPLPSASPTTVQSFVRSPCSRELQLPESTHQRSNFRHDFLSPLFLIMTIPANAAIREQRRRSTTFDIEQMNVMKALTAAEYSRRQFVLNFAASKDTRLLIPGQKAEAIKEAEEWTVAYLNEHGFSAVANDLFKYTVDARLWTTLGAHSLLSF